MRNRLVLAAVIAAVFVAEGHVCAETKVTTSKPAATASDAPKAPAEPARTIDPPKPAASFPRTLPEARAEAEARTQPQPGWPAQEIELARARCTQLLKTIDAVAIPEPPMREGECGAPAPIRLVSIGRNPEVAISPPAVVSCDFAVALHTWVKADVQPLARKHLGSAIVKIESMSDYSCRNAYGRVKTRLSEHGRANALDIRGFLAQSGQAITVLDDWGMTAREIAAAVAAEKKAAEKTAAERALAEAAARQKTAVAKQPPADANAAVAQRPLVPPDVLNRRTLIEGLPRVSIGEAGSEPATAPAPVFGVLPSKLGGPKPPLKRAAEAPKPSSPPTPEAKAMFLRQAHAAGCRTFGTVLGPEANNAHRNHFHVDMAERNSGTFCE